MNREKESNAGWDARHEFVRELVYRAHLYLNSNPRNPEQWFETLRDFYSIACPFIKDTEQVKKRINTIKEQIYALRVNGRTLSERERRANLEAAYEGIRELFETIHIQVYRSGIYLPIYRKIDPGQAITQMED